MAQTRAAIEKRWRDKRVAKGLCPRCGKHPVEKDRSRCTDCLDIGAVYSKQYRDRLIANGQPYKRPNPPKGRSQRRTYLKRYIQDSPESTTVLFPLRFDPVRKCFVRVNA